ncbi:MAG: SWIB/MDM2 domain-containing protein [Patescibacteria group bacterium]
MATNSAFAKPQNLSSALQAVVGSGPMPRTEVVKQLWVYIKKHNLQNPQNKRNILCDEKLKAVFGKGEVTMFEMGGLIGKHLS